MAVHQDPPESIPTPPGEGITVEQLRGQREPILAIAKRHHATNVRVIGSVARRGSDQFSDVDFMLDMDPERKLKGLAYFGELDDLVNDLAAFLGCNVDVVDAITFERNRPMLRSQVTFRERVSRDAVAL